MKDVSENDIKHNLKFVAKKRDDHRSKIKIGKDIVGGETPVIFAGPCRVESLEQMRIIAKTMRKNNLQLTRFGVYKPCTFPYADTGMGLEGLKIIKKIKEEFDVLSVTEIMSINQINEAIDYVDVIQVGARNMQNYNLLAEFGKTKKPILLKRHPGTSLRDFLGSAEWIMAHGNEKVILCERGVTIPYTHDVNARWALDITIVPAIRKYTHLPIVIDPSHSAGIREFVPSLSRASIAAGADGLAVEFHPEPDKSHSDPLQAINLKTFDKLVQDTYKISEVLN